MALRISTWPRGTARGPVAWHVYTWHGTARHTRWDLDLSDLHLDHDSYQDLELDPDLDLVLGPILGYRWLSEQLNLVKTKLLNFAQNTRLCENY